MNVSGALADTSGVTVSGSGLLAGSGSVNAPVTDNAFVAPGGGNGGTAILTVGKPRVRPRGAPLEVDLDGTNPGSSYDQLNVNAAALDRAHA